MVQTHWNSLELVGDAGSPFWCQKLMDPRSLLFLYNVEMKVHMCEPIYGTASFNPHFEFFIISLGMQPNKT